MNFSLIGAGFIMPRHAEAINSIGGRIIDVVNTAHGFDTWKDVVKNEKTDCIVILTPNDLHYEMAKTALENGKKVLCEKPLAINSEQAKDLAKYDGVYTILQLHHHPAVKELKESLSTDENYEIDMDISVHRDPHYYEIWKGQPERSGGVLFNLGIHYFDLLLHLFGEPESVTTDYLDDKTGYGTMKGKNYNCKWKISTAEARDSQRRVFEINGKKVNLSSKDNLSYENHHRFVYKDLLEGKGITPAKALPSIELVEKLYSAFKKK